MILNVLLFNGDLWLMCTLCVYLGTLTQGKPINGIFLEKIIIL